MFKVKSRKFPQILLSLLGIFFLSVFGVEFISSSFGEFYLNNPIFHLLFVIIIILVTVLFAIFIKNLVLFFYPKFRTNLRFKIFSVFVLLILGPALFTIFLSSGVVNKGLDRLLRIQVKRIVNLSYETSEEFLNFISKDLGRKISQLTYRKVYPYTLKIYGIDGYLKVDLKKKKIISRVGTIPLSDKEIIAVSKVDNYHYLDSKEKLFIACRKKPFFLVCVSKKFPESLVKDIEKIRTLRSNYETLVTYERPIKTVYTLAFALMGVAVLFGALWFARYFERRISVPIEALYRATKKMSKGDLNVRVEEEGTDELKHVITAFNYMVEQLRALKQRLEDSRKYIEKVINSISPAIITFNNEGKIISCNLSAKELLGVSKRKGDYLWDLLEDYPELKKAVEKLLEKGVRRTEVREEINGREKFLSVELIVSPEIGDRVLIVEDLTNLVKAQKAEAWKEVAQRIAHEIKNPLTPITLNAERIRRQHKKKNPQMEKVIDKAVDSILAEVEVIRRLIDEFRRFARLPLPEKKLTDVNELLRSTLEPYENKVKIIFELENLPQIPVDRSLMREVFTNLIDNSIEAGSTEVSVSTTTKDGKVFIVFRDNGPGIPEEIMDKLFSPYISTKEEGWGLGLSIVKKIIEDHGGKIYTVNRNTFVIELPI
ncbi:MAG: ATP-binding protein [Desulfurobacteriaceae bacterium]